MTGPRRSSPPPLVALITDFGHADAFVGEMHLAILAIEPRARIVDVTHGIAPFDRIGAALAAERAWPLLPAGAALVVVVDPGVGGARRRIVRVEEDRFMVGPDNGVFPAAHRAARSYEIDAVRFAPAAGVCTFDGREVFAPVAARLARGEPVSRIGRPIEHEVASVLPADAIVTAGVAKGVVLALDRFGNAVTNLRSSATSVRNGVAPLGDGVTSALALRIVRPTPFAGFLRSSYDEVAPGEPLALVGSAGRVELSRREAPSGLGVGTPVVAKVSFDRVGRADGVAPRTRRRVR